MVDVVTLGITLISQLLQYYDSIKSLTKNCAIFGVFWSPSRAFCKTYSQPTGRGLRGTSLHDPLKLLLDAVKEGEEILRECSRDKKLKARMWSRTYLNKLNAVSSKLNQAMQLIGTSGVGVQGSLKEAMEETSEKIDRLQQHIAAHNHEIADLTLQHSENMTSEMRGLPEQIVQLLLERNVGDDRQDLMAQLHEITAQAEELRRGKAFADEQLFQALTLMAQQEEQSSTTRQDSSYSEADLEDQKCPISLEVMKDPVTLWPSNQTYERKWICDSLLSQLNQDPATGIRYDQKLQYQDDYRTRRQLARMFGEAHLERYDDSGFAEQYNAKWDEFMGSEFRKFGTTSDEQQQQQEPHGSTARGAFVVNQAQEANLKCCSTSKDDDTKNEKTQHQLPTHPLVEHLKLKASHTPTSIEAALEFIQKSCHRNNRERVSIADAGGVDLIVATMKAHPNTAGIQTEGCGSLRNLTHLNSENQTRVVQAGGVELVVAAMMAHTGETKLQESACYALGYWAHNDAGNQERITAARGLEALAEAAQSDVATVKDRATYALRNLNAPTG